jgi:hypothetical protein
MQNNENRGIKIAIKPKREKGKNKQQNNYLENKFLLASARLIPLGGIAKGEYDLS